MATARRDLEALSAAGIPVYPQPGRGGGWSLVGGARTDLTGLTSSEAQALFLLVGPASRPVRRRCLGAAQARARPARHVPRRRRGRGRAVVVDPAGGANATRARAASTSCRTPSCVVGRSRSSNRGAPAEPAAGRPVGARRQGRHLVPVAGTPQGRRTFRVDRIVGGDVLDPGARGPTSSTSPRVGAGGRRGGGAPLARVRDGARARRGSSRARGQFGRHCDSWDPRRRARPGPSWRRPWPLGRRADRRAGASVEVVSPPRSSGELAPIGARSWSRHSGDVGGPR